MRNKTLPKIKIRDKILLNSLYGDKKVYSKLTKLKKRYLELPEMAKASLWFTVCNILSKGIALLSTPIFTRILTPEQYGDFAVFQSWYSIIIIFSSLNLFLGVYGKGLIEFEKDRDRFTSALLGLTFFITSIVLLIYMAGMNFFTDFFGLAPHIMACMFIELYTMPAYEFWSVRQRYEYKYRKLVVISLSMTIVSIVVSIITVMNTTYKLEARVASDVFVKAIVGFGIFIIIFSKSKYLYNKKYWKYALVFNIPLIPHFLSTMILNQSDRIMIKTMCGPADAAIYSLAYTIGTVALLVINAVNSSLTPYIYEKLKKKDYFSIKKVTRLLVILVVLMTAMFMLFAPEVIYIFAGREYYEAIGVIPPVAVSMFFIFLYSLYSNIEYYYKRTTYIALASTICAVVNIILNYLLIPIFGYYAAGYTTLICYVFYTIMHGFFCKKILNSINVKLQEVFSIKNDIASIFFIILLMGIVLMLYNYFLVRYVILLIIMIMCIIKRKYLISVFEKIKK